MCYVFQLTKVRLSMSSAEIKSVEESDSIWVRERVETGTMKQRPVSNQPLKSQGIHTCPSAVNTLVLYFDIYVSGSRP